jgi:hypothetical protein
MTTGFIYGQYPLNLMKHKVSDLSSASTHIKCALLLATHTPNQDTQEAWADVKADEHGATGSYVAGGVACGTKTVVYASKVTTFDLDNPYWASITVANVRYLCFYDDTPAADADKKLLAIFDLGTAISVTTSPLSFNINTAGLYADVVA